MGFTLELSIPNIVFVAFLYIVGNKLKNLYKMWRTQEMLEKWNKTPKDKVILHGIVRGRTLPSISPFVLKLETYLRIAKIPYELDDTDPFGPKGKMPWISFNGRQITDSHFIIQFLNKKFEINLNRHLTPEQVEICRSIRIMLENHFLFGGLISWRFLDNVKAIGEIQKFPTLIQMLFTFQKSHFTKLMENHGIGRHSLDDRLEMTYDDLKTVSKILGKKNYLGGDQPGEDDCAIFGMLAQVLWGMPGSPQEKILHGELHNLKTYCERMKKFIWPDWNQCLDQSY